MNGSWYPWGRNGANTPEKYVAAWQRLHDLFSAAGATNVQWVWSPNVLDSDVGAATVPFEPYFPGDAYVDWLALDGYNFAPSGWLWFKQLFGASYDRITALSARPLMIAEMASANEQPNQAAEGDTKAKWIADAFTDEIPHVYPRIRAVVWFNEDKTNLEANGNDWRIASSASAQRAFAAAVASSYYLSHWP
ncbi:MAG TPA: glycosyl hydrolase [Dehalococcoidia bacterium]|nr:glycosyl hydrolase [Dehalococcoidia bacterium]